MAHQETAIGDLDLGFDDDDVPLPAPRQPPSPAAGLAPFDAPPAAAPPAIAPEEDDAMGGDEALSFINDKAEMAQMAARNRHPEYKIRRRNGRIEGPYGIPRIQTLLRNRALQGSEDISEDGSTWRKMTSIPALNATLNELHASEDQMAFGNVDLPISASTDLPAPASLPAPKTSGLSASGSLDFSSADLDSGDIRGPKVASSPMGDPSADLQFEAPVSGGLGAPSGAGLGGAGRLPDHIGGSSPREGAGGISAIPAKPPSSAASGVSGGLSADLGGSLSADLGGSLSANLGGSHSADLGGSRSADLGGSHSADLNGPPSSSALDAASHDLAKQLEVGDVPDLPPFWETYKNHILAFTGVVVFVLIGVYTQFFTPVGAYGVPAVVALLTASEPPPPPPAPPPAPPKVADPNEVANLIDEHSYESFRSVFATLQAAGANLADNRLMLAKARGLATLAYGPEVFPLTELTNAVAALNTIDLSGAMKGDALAANLAIAKARSSLQILGGEQQAAADQLDGLLEANPSDKELALLSGLAKMRLDKHEAAVAALDKALVAAPDYAPALHAMGQSVEALGGQKAAADAAAWFTKAIRANPNHSRSGLEAARLFRGQNKFGHYRRVLELTAEHADRGLPPAARPAFLHRVATEYDRQGRLAEAAPFAIEAARLQPGNQAYVALAAIAHAETGQADQGLALLDPVLARDPNDADSLLARARVYVMLEDIAKGFIDLDKARTAAPSDLRVPLWEARFNIQLGKFKDAQKSLRRAVRLAGDDARPHVEQGRLHLKLGNVDAAYESAKAAVKVAPNEARAHTLLGACYGRRGQLKKAEKSYARALKLDDESLDARLGYANALRDQGAKQARPADSEALARAIPLYLQALSEHPDNPQIMFEYGRALELQDDLPSALALYAQAAALDAQDVRPHLKMVAAYLTQTNVDLDRAVASLKRARDIEIRGGLTMPEVRFWEARVALLQGRRRDGVNAMRKAVEGAPENALYQYWMGRALEANNSLYEAITHYEEAVELNSRYADAIRALGRAALERRLFKEARAYFRKYQKVAPDDPTVLIDIGNSYAMMNRKKEAEAAFKEALRKLPNNLRALLELGIVNDWRGDRKQALAYYRKAARVHPDNGEAVCRFAVFDAEHRRARLTATQRAQLKACVEHENAPADQKDAAADILQTPGR